jgi:hypothetical protein
MTGTVFSFYLVVYSLPARVEQTICRLQQRSHLGQYSRTVQRPAKGQAAQGFKGTGPSFLLTKRYSCPDGTSVNWRPVEPNPSSATDASSPLLRALSSDALYDKPIGPTRSFWRFSGIAHSIFHARNRQKPTCRVNCLLRDEEINAAAAWPAA